MERLQKILARAGVASRREAESLITDGQVTVNGEVVTELGVKADAAKDHIKVNGKLVQVDEEMTYILLNKPKGVVTTVHDPEGRVTVTSLLKEVKGRIYPVGRLDFNTEGALLLTNDGNLTHKLLAPKSKCPKTYVVKVGGSPDKKTLVRLERGITVDGSRFGRCEIEMLKAGSNSWLRVILFEGKNHQIKKMFETVGHPVSKLRRIAFAFLTTKGLKPGEWRYLNPVEIERLQRGDYQFLKPLNPFKFLREVGVALKSGDYEAYRQEKGEPPMKTRDGSRPGKGTRRPRPDQPGMKRPARSGKAPTGPDSKRGGYRRGEDETGHERPERPRRSGEARSEGREFGYGKKQTGSETYRDRKGPRSNRRFEGESEGPSRRGEARKGFKREDDRDRRDSRPRGRYEGESGGPARRGDARKGFKREDDRDRRDSRPRGRYEGESGGPSRRGEARKGFKREDDRDRRDSRPRSRQEGEFEGAPRRGEVRRGFKPDDKGGAEGRPPKKYSPRSRTRAKTGEKTWRDDENRNSDKGRPAKYKAKRPQKAWAKSLDRSHKKGSGKK